MKLEDEDDVKPSKQIKKSNNKKKVFQIDIEDIEKYLFVPKVKQQKDLMEDDVEMALYAQTTAEKVSNSLVKWYTKQSRDHLPWRDIPSNENDVPEKLKTHFSNKTLPFVLQQHHAYRVWVSELMCQQTQVETVIPYFKKWMGLMPSILHVAETSQDDVNALWSGLGYYRRAKYLKKGLDEVVLSHKGVIPNTADALQKIPGIGQYTAGAIASISFRKRAPLVDGNVTRVLSRLRAIEYDVMASQTQKQVLWPLSTSLVNSIPEKVHPGDLNQAIMEFGALLCTPKNPSCQSCPLSKSCVSHQLFKLDKIKSVERYPIKKKKSKQKTSHWIAVVYSDSNNRIFMKKRPAEGLLSNLYEFPNVPLSSEFMDSRSFDHTTDVLWPYYQREITQHNPLSHDYLMDLSNHTMRYAGVVKHVFSHLIHFYHVLSIGQVDVQEAAVNSIRPEAWIPPSEFEDYGIPTVMMKVYKMAHDTPNRKRKSSSQSESKTQRKKKQLRQSNQSTLDMFIVSKKK